MMKQLNVAVTSGGTQEYIDDVRVITNISTGRLGSMIAEKFIDAGHNVFYVAPRTACAPGPMDQAILGYDRRVTKDTASVMEVMKELVPKMDVVIQCMAISDFTFDRNKPVKVSSKDLDGFIEHMRQTIVKTPKVISNFRAWNPKAILVGFKFTVGASKDEQTEIATALMDDNRLDMVFANDKAQMKKRGAHVGRLIMKDWTEDVHSKEEIAGRIFENVVRLAGRF
jgi:phosphopantothenate-cysteine ligase